MQLPVAPALLHWPAGQLLHVVSAVADPPVANLPAAHVCQAEQDVKSLPVENLLPPHAWHVASVAALHVVLRYCPAPHVLHCTQADVPVVAE